MNMAARMQTTGEPNRLHVSQAVTHRIAGSVRVTVAESRAVKVKGKGDLTCSFVDYAATGRGRRAAPSASPSRRNLLADAEARTALVMAQAILVDAGLPVGQGTDGAPGRSSDLRQVGNPRTFGLAGSRAVALLQSGVVAPSGLFAIGSDPFRTSGANVACHVLNLSRAPSFEHTARASRSSLRLPRGAEVDHDATVSREPQAGNVSRVSVNGFTARLTGVALSAAAGGSLRGASRSAKTSAAGASAAEGAGQSSSQGRRRRQILPRGHAPSAISLAILDQAVATARSGLVVHLSGVPQSLSGVPQSLSGIPQSPSGITPHTLLNMSAISTKGGTPGGLRGGSLIGGSVRRSRSESSLSSRITAAATNAAMPAGPPPPPTRVNVCGSIFRRGRGGARCPTRPAGAGGPPFFFHLHPA